MTKPLYFNAACTACRNAFVVVDYAPIHCPACGERLDASSQLGIDWCVNDSADTHIVAVNRSKRMVYIKGPLSPSAATDERDRILRLINESEVSEREAGHTTEADALRALREYLAERCGGRLMAGRRKRMALASEEQRAEWIERYRFVWASRSKRVRRNRRHPRPTVDLLPFFRAAFPQKRIERMFYDHSPVLAAAGFYANKTEWLALKAEEAGFGGSILDAARALPLAHDVTVARATVLLPEIKEPR